MDRMSVEWQMVIAAYGFMIIMFVLVPLTIGYVNSQEATAKQVKLDSCGGK